MVRRETRFSLKISLCILLFVIGCGVASGLMGGNPHPTERLKTIWQIMDVVAILMVIVVLAVRKTIYFSPRRIRGEFKLSAILRIWRKIDLWLLITPVVIALLGLAMAVIGMPFSFNWPFFATAFMLTMILMPIPWKVKDKIRYFEKFVGQWNE